MQLLRSEVTAPSPAAARRSERPRLWALTKVLLRGSPATLEGTPQTELVEAVVAAADRANPCRACAVLPLRQPLRILKASRGSACCGEEVPQRHGIVLSMATAGTQGLAPGISPPNNRHLQRPGFGAIEVAAVRLVER